MFYHQPMTIKFQPVQPAFQQRMQFPPMCNTTVLIDKQQKQSTKPLRYLNESSGAKNNRESIKIVQYKQEPVNVNNSMSRLTSKPLQFVQQTQFGQTFPIRKKAFSPTRIVPANQNNFKSITTVNNSQQERTFSQERATNYLKRLAKNQENLATQSDVVEVKPVDVDLKKNWKKSLELQYMFEKSSRIPASPRQQQNMYIISPADHQIIQESPYHEDRGDVEQVQGQGSEQLIADDDEAPQLEGDPSFDSQKQRKSITLFEMKYNEQRQNSNNEVLEAFQLNRNISGEFEAVNDESRLVNMKVILDRLSSYSAETLVEIQNNIISQENAKRMKVLVNGHYDEREFYIDIGQIPQEWKLKQLAIVVNKMYGAQQGEQYQLKMPAISILSGRVHTQRLDQNLYIFELIDIALTGGLGKENLIILEEWQ